MHAHALKLNNTFHHPTCRIKTSVSKTMFMRAESTIYPRTPPNAWVPYAVIEFPFTTKLQVKPGRTGSVAGWVTIYADSQT